jgi:trans-aconitate methyltransferase
MSQPSLDTTSLSLLALVELCSQKLREQSEVSLCAIDPDTQPIPYSGEFISGSYHRNWKTWLELAESLNARMTTAEKIFEDKVSFKLVSLDSASSWHTEAPKGTEKYGMKSDYAKVDKREDPFWVRDYRAALGSLKLTPQQKILSLGVGRGDELSVFKPWFPELEPSLSFVGLDHCASAIAQAQKIFPSPNYHFEERDLLTEWDKGRDFDVLISIATLQCSGFEGKSVFRSWYQQALKPNGSLILGFPCCRYVDGQVISGPKVKNFKDPEWSLLMKDIAYFSRYLTSHKKRVVLTGRNTLFLTATPVT